MIGDKWNEEEHGEKREFYGEEKCKALIYFMDKACVAYDGKPMDWSISHTRELYVGPSMMVFHIPLPDTGDVKLFVTTTPIDQQAGSIMRVRMWLSNKTWKLWFWSWFVGGVSVSQMLADIKVMESRIRKRKPCIVPGDGPFNRVNRWLRQFYTDADMAVADDDGDDKKSDASGVKKTKTKTKRPYSSFDCDDW